MSVCVQHREFRHDARTTLDFSFSFPFSMTFVKSGCAGKQCTLLKKTRKIIIII